MTSKPTTAGSAAPPAANAVGYGARMIGAPPGGAATALAVTLTIPARSDHLRFARLMAVGVATKLGFDYDAIEDLRIAVSELCTALIGACDGNGEMTLTYRSDGDAMAIDAHATYASGVRAGAGPDALLSAILDSVADEHRLDLGDTGATFMLRVRATPTDVL